MRRLQWVGREILLAAEFRMARDVCMLASQRF